jgi:hypothetical protein|nr:MAG: hypothetical protein [Caudoviricetes sp.]
MSDFSDVFKNKLKKKTEELDYSSSSNFLEQISEELKTEIENNKVLQFKKSLAKTSKETKQKILESEVNIFSSFESVEIIKNETVEPLIEEVVFPIEKQTEPKQDFISSVVNSITKEETNKIKEHTDLFNQPNVKLVDPTVKSLQDKLKFLEDWVSKISMAGPGGGEVNFRYLDDVNSGSIGENKYLTYNQDNRKFYFDYITNNTIVNNTTFVTSNTYSLVSTDYYVGVNSPEATTIFLQTTAQEGKIIVIKDESGNCSTNPISVVGNVDNDIGGFILKIDNGAIQMVYRNGWRII